MRIFTGASGLQEERMKATEEDTMVPTTSSANNRVEEAGRLSSIEMEPKTLTLDQMKYAREAALRVVSTKTEEEAIRIFTAGLKPVQVSSSSTPVRNKSSSVDSSDDDVDLDGSCGLGGSGRKGSYWRHSGWRKASSIDDIRDVATAPF